MRRLILRNPLSPGDIVMLTAAVRDLHECHPHQFLTDVRTYCPSLWENNPHLTPLNENEPDVEVIDCDYPLINRSNQAPYHCLHGFIDFLNERLKLNIRPTAFKGDIHLSDLERSWYSQVHELTGEDTPFWIVVAGGKYDATIKWWRATRYQAVVDHFRGKIQFVQVGERGHYHPKLEGVIDLRGKTDLRQLVRLVYHSQGVLCGVTALMHLAAAIEGKPGMPSNRPCVVVAGGREPVQWEAYPHHQFIHTIGALPCCDHGGCWRARTVPLGDGDERDQPDRLCLDVVDELPRCMNMITSEEVIRRIEHYFDGGVARFLTRAEAKVARNGIIATQANPFDETPLTVSSARAASEDFIRTIPASRPRFRGRGIVICGGGVRHFPSVWVCINTLKRLGCALPIELWHLDGREMDRAMRKALLPFGVRCIDGTKVRQGLPARILKRWELKPYAILHSRFNEVLLLDADTVPLINPECLFETPQFKQAGAIFWPDVGRSRPLRTAWDFCGVPQPKEPPFESGQIVVNKARCWPALRLCLWYHENSDFFRQHVSGENETFHLAFRKLNEPFAMPDQPIRRSGGARFQHDFEGRRIFERVKTNTLDEFLTNRQPARFPHEAERHSDLAQLRRIWDGGMSRYKSNFKPGWRPNGRSGDRPIKVDAWMISCGERQRVRERTLRNLAWTDWGERPVSIQLDPGRSEDRIQRITHNYYLALRHSRRSDADYILVLEDDLEFNRFIWENLQNWEPLKDRVLAFGSLFNPDDVTPLACAAGRHFFIAEPFSVHGSQAFLMASDVVRQLINHWEEIQAPPDLKMPRLLAELNHPIVYHAPSLVQHRRVKSTWGGAPGKASDFNPLWKATESAHVR